jgi:hypothetical protein
MPSCGRVVDVLADQRLGLARQVRVDAGDEDRRDEGALPDLEARERRLDADGQVGRAPFLPGTAQEGVLSASRSTPSTRARAAPSLTRSWSSATA